MSIISISVRGLRDASRNFRKELDAFELAVKHQRRRPSDETRGRLVTTRERLVQAHIEADVVVKAAERAGLQVRTLKSDMELAVNMVAEERRRGIRRRGW